MSNDQERIAELRAEYEIAGIASHRGHGDAGLAMLREFANLLRSLPEKPHVP